MIRTALAQALALSLALALTSASGCKKDSASANKDTVSPPADLALPIASTDEVWALAPAGTKLALVAGPQTGSILLGAVNEIKRSMSTHPMGATILDKMRADMPDDMPKNLLEPSFHQEVGIDLSRPAAVFVRYPDDDAQVVVILPVADPAKLVAYAKGSRDEAQGVDIIDDMRCKQISGHYACAKTDQELEMVGKDATLKKAMVDQPKRLRGHIEGYLETRFFGNDLADFKGFLSDLGPMRGALKLERGGFAAHWHLTGTPAHAIAKGATKIETTLAKRVANKNPAGFWRVSVPLQAIVPPDAAEAMAAGARQMNINAKDDILDNATGEVVMYALAQRGLGLVVEFGAKDGRRLQPIINFICGMAQLQIPPTAKEWLSVDKNGDRCKARLNPSKMGDLMPPNMPFTGPIVAEMYTTDISLAIGLNAETNYRSNPVAANPTGKDLLVGAWNMAMWGYGSFAGMFESGFYEQMRNLPEFRDESFNEAMFGMWMLGHLTEMGMGAAVRDNGLHLTMRAGTQWANDAQLLHELQAILTKTVAGDKSASGKLKALADKSPDSPFGRSFRAGTGSGPMVAISLIGVAAAVAIPAFMKYISRSKSSEANMFLRKMHLGARTYTIEGSARMDSLAPPTISAPMQSVGPTPPLGTCCAQGGTCQPTAAWWTHPTWMQLQFAVTDPHRYSYQYEVDATGRRYTARALGDLDCDGVYSTFEMYGEVKDGGEVTGSQIMRMNELE